MEYPCTAKLRVLENELMTISQKGNKQTSANRIKNSPNKNTAILSENPFVRRTRGGGIRATGRFI
jgi:hypothetical protein